MADFRVKRLSVVGFWVAGAAIGIGVTAQACSSEFVGCESARDCPLTGDAGEAGQTNSDGKAGTSSGGNKGDMSSAGASGEAGAAGAKPVVTCSKDSDCSDGLACNGVETCESGVCTPGTSPCTNPDAANCDVVCDETNGKATCGARGQDSDGDGHFSSACTANPGDDCNDTKATVHPGAPELCDQIDNDCNGKIDVADGLPAGGKTVEIGPGGTMKVFPHIAWSPPKGAYGVVYTQDTNSGSGVYFEEIDQSGGTVLAPELVNVSIKSPDVGPGQDLGFVWGKDAFAVVWSSSGGHEFRSVTPDGDLRVNELTLDADSYGSAVIARNANGTWATVFNGSIGNGTVGQPRHDEIFAPTISAVEVETQHPLVANSGQNLAIASSGANFAIGFDSSSGTATRVFSESMTPVADIGVLYSPVISGGVNGFAIASHASSQSTSYSVIEYSSSGVQQCGPLAFPTGFAPASITATSNGYLALSTMLEAVEITNDCKLGTKFTVDTPSKAVTNAQISAGDAGDGVVWQDPADNKPKMRIIGPHYCD